MKKTYRISEIAKIVNVNPETLRRWDNTGRVKALRLESGQRRYTDEHIRQILNLPLKKTEKRNVIYARVSNHGQKPDLENQINTLENFAIGRGLITETIPEIGGGMNFKRKKFNEIIRDIINGQIGTLIIAHKDRFARFGFDLIQNIADTFGCEILILNQEKLSPQEEMVEDLMTIIHTFSSRLYGLRKYKTVKDVMSDEDNENTSDSDSPEQQTKDITE